MSFNFIKNAIGASSDGPVSDLFNNSNLNTKNIIIYPEQYYELFDAFRAKSKLSLSFLHSHLIDYIFTNMGGNKDTKPVDVLAFSYMLLNTDVFKFNLFTDEAVMAINFDTMCYYIEENNLTAPTSFLVDIADNLNNKDLYNIIIDRFSFEVATYSVEDTQLFYKKIISEILPFMSGVSSTNKMLDSLGIKLQK